MAEKEKKEAKQEASEKKGTEDKTAQLKQKIAELKNAMVNLNTLTENCQKIKQQKRVIISEDAPDKDQSQVFKFALTGGIVLDIMAVVERFISEMKDKTLQQQDQLLEELSALL